MEHTKTQQQMSRVRRDTTYRLCSSKHGLLAMFLAITISGMLTLSGCTTTDPEQDVVSMPIPTIPESGPSFESHEIQSKLKNSNVTFSLEDRMLFSNDLHEDAHPAPPELGPLYSFRAHELPLIDALALFARSNKLNIVTGPEITGTTTIDFHDLPLEQAMSALLEAHGYYWEHHDNLIQIRRFKTARINVDYIRLIRGGEGQNQAQMSSGSSGGGGSQETGQITVNQKDEIKFWEELENQIETLMSDDGRLVINKLSGTIQLTDWYQRVDEIEEFLKSVHQALHRQVQIEARIYEVNLSDDYSLGIDWTRVDFLGDSSGLLAASASIIAPPIASPIGGFIARPATTAIAFNDASFQGVILALQEQGDLRVVSQPRVVTLNNQPALIKVATDQPFFTQTVTQGTSGTGNIVTEQANSVTVGLVLSVTPQISDDGWIMMDVTPIISSLRNIADSPLGTSNAPVLDVKQSSGLVRLKDGEMIIIGGLIQEKSSETIRKVPLLGDLPYLGRLFRGSYTVKTKSELVIFISPKIVKGS